MGCDIHMFPEKKESYGWRFVYRHSPDRPNTVKDKYPRPDRDNYFGWDDRDYWFFGQLAGVREDGPPIAEQRGIPKDAHYQTSEFANENADHSYSWLSLEELLSHDWQGQMPNDPWKESRLKRIFAWLDRLKEIDPDPKNVRIVFGFDS